MNKNLTAKDIMTKSVITLTENQTLAEAWKILASHKITGAPVLDDEGNLTGVVSQTDILRETASEAFDKFPKGLFYNDFPHFDGSYWPTQPDILHEMTVSEVMNSEPICANDDTPISSLASQMRKYKIHRLPITKGTNIVGVVTTMDLIEILE
jgi:CBS domain-containing protein